MTHTTITVQPFPRTLRNVFEDTLYLEATEIPLGTKLSMNQHKMYLRYILAFL